MYTDCKFYKQTEIKLAFDLPKLNAGGGGGQYFLV